MRPWAFVVSVALALVAGFAAGVLVRPSNPNAGADAGSAPQAARERDAEAYFRHCHELAKSQDEGAYAAVVQMLDAPGFEVSEPTPLDQYACVRLCLLAMPEERWVAQLAERLPREKDAATARTIVRCLADAVTAEADAAVRALADDERADGALRAFAAGKAASAAMPIEPKGNAGTLRADFDFFLAAAEQEGRLPKDPRVRAVRRDGLHHVRATDAFRLRDVRRKVARVATDDALVQIDYLTALLRRAVGTPQ